MNTYDEFPDVPAYMLDGVEDTDSSVTPYPDIDEVIEELHKDDDLPTGEDNEDIVDLDEEEEEEELDEEDEPELEDEEDSSDED
jgi:hypothetical protein